MACIQIKGTIDAWQLWLYRTNPFIYDFFFFDELWRRIHIRKLFKSINWSVFYEYFSFFYKFHDMDSRVEIVLFMLNTIEEICHWHTVFLFNCSVNLGKKVIRYVNTGNISFFFYLFINSRYFKYIHILRS